jgi:hypothetical protein
MSYTGFSAKNFSSRFFPGAGDFGRRNSLLAQRKDGVAHRAKLILISDFLQPIVADPALSQSPTSGAHFGCGAAEPPEVPGGGTTFGSCTLGAPFSMAGSTSFGWITPFDWFSFLLRSTAGAVGSAPGLESRGADSEGGVGFGAWANAGPATNAAPATSKQIRVLMIRMPLKRADVPTVPLLSREACFPPTKRGPLPFNSHVRHRSPQRPLNTDSEHLLV